MTTWHGWQGKNNSILIWFSLIPKAKATFIILNISWANRVLDLHNLPDRYFAIHKISGLTLHQLTGFSVRVSTKFLCILTVGSLGDFNRHWTSITWKFESLYEAYKYEGLNTVSGQYASEFVGWQLGLKNFQNYFFIDYI